MAEGILAVTVMIWLIVCAGYDLRTRTVPNWLTLIPLFGALLFVCLRGFWPAAGLVIGMILLSDLSKRLASGLALLALLAAGLLSYSLFHQPLDALLTLVLVFFTWLLWLYGLTGGADAKILMTLTLLYGGGVFIAATLAGGAFGLGALLLKKRMLPYVLPMATGTSLFLVFSLVKIF
jgi:Flp pilus assembly protein protease CpaA